MFNEVEKYVDDEKVINAILLQMATWSKMEELRFINERCICIKG